MHLFRQRRPLVVIFAVFAMLLIGFQPAAAYTVVSRSGATGPYSLTDAAAPFGTQGATCFYGTSSYKLVKIEVRRPQVKARNRTNGRDSQSVGWQFIVQHQTPSGTTWATIYGSTFVKATAYDNLAASFANRSWVAPADPSGRYRLLVVIRWYTPGGSSTIEGQVKVRDQYYKLTWNGNPVLGDGSCLQDY